MSRLLIRFFFEIERHPRRKKITSLDQLQKYFYRHFKNVSANVSTFSENREVTNKTFAQVKF